MTKNKKADPTAAEETSERDNDIYTQTCTLVCVCVWFVHTSHRHVLPPGLEP